MKAARPRSLNFDVQKLARQNRGCCAPPVRGVRGLGTLIVKNSQNQTKGILTDGDVKRLTNMGISFKETKINKVMKKNPISVEKNMLAAKALSIMNDKKITSLCVHHNNKNKTIGFIHIHNVLDANIT